MWNGCSYAFLFPSFTSLQLSPSTFSLSCLATGVQCSYFILPLVVYFTFSASQFYFCWPVSFPVASCGLYMSIFQLFRPLRCLFSLGNFKAVYHRAQAHAALCNEDEARRDFDMVEKLDPKFKPFVRQELKKLGDSMRTMHARQNKTYWDTTQEKWGPGGSKAESAARKKNVKFAQKATEEKTEADKKKTEVRKTEYKESSEKPAPAETEGVDDAETEKNPDVKAEQSNKELEGGRVSGEGLDNETMESVMVHEDGQGAPDNRATNKDSDPPATSTGKDNVVSKRSECDKGRKKVKCQSSAAPAPSGASQGNKATSDKTGNGRTQSE